MNSLLIYLLKVSLGIAIISIPYYFLLRSDRNLNVKRFFLLGGLILSFILPLIKVSISSNIVSDIPVFFLNLENPSIEVGTAGSEVSRVSPSFNFAYLALAFYLLGIFVLFSRNIFSMISWLKIKKSSFYLEKGVLYSENNEVFTLFNTIHVPKSVINTEAHSSILIHEQAHIRQMHFIDLLVNEFAVLLTWFNPFTWLITRMIKENHEHLADREVLLQGVNPARYRAHLLNQTLGLRVFRLGHSFNYSLTKKRFEMMKNKNSKWNGIVKFAFLLPAVVLSLGFLSVSNAQDGKLKGTVKFSDTGKPAAGTAIVIKGSTVGTVADESGNFELQLADKAELVFSYVGYKNAVVTCEPGQKLKVNLEVEVINLDISNKEIKGENNSVDGVIEKTSKNEVEERSIGDEVFYIVEEMPKFPGGKEALTRYIYTNLQYPAQAEKEKIEGRVMVEFIVDGYGKVVNPKVTQSSNSIFDAAALKVFETMPDWTPGKQRGKSVKVKFTAPVIFTLPVSES